MLLILGFDNLSKPIYIGLTAQIADNKICQVSLGKSGLIREYLPKGCDFRPVSDDEVQAIEDRINNRPRKWLGFKTPNQVFYSIT